MVLIIVLRAGKMKITKDKIICSNRFTKRIILEAASGFALICLNKIALTKQQLVVWRELISYRNLDLSLALLALWRGHGLIPSKTWTLGLNT